MMSLTLALTSLIFKPLSFQKWMRWVGKKRMLAANASYSALPSRMLAFWQASPSCSSSPPTLDRSSWDKYRSPQKLTPSAKQCEVKVSWSVLVGSVSKRKSSLSFFCPDLKVFWLPCGWYAHSCMEENTQLLMQFPYAVDSRRRWWQPSSVSVWGLFAG